MSPTAVAEAMGGAYGHGGCDAPREGCPMVMVTTSAVREIAMVLEAAWTAEPTAMRPASNMAVVMPSLQASVHAYAKP